MSDSFVGPPAVGDRGSQPSTVNRQPASLAGRLSKVADAPVSADRALYQSSVQGHAERLERVRLTIDDLKALIRLVAQVGDRLTAIEAEVDDSLPPAVRDHWLSAGRRLQRFLDTPLQLRDGQLERRLEESLGDLQHLVATFEENAVGAGGEGLEESPERLAKFESMLDELDPRPESLLAQARDLLAERGLDLTELSRAATSVAEQASRDDARKASLAAVVRDLETVWQEHLVTMERSVADLRASLESLGREELTPATRARVADGVASLAQVPITQLRRELTAIRAWAEQFQDDPRFTKASLVHRIQAELAPLQTKVREAIADLTSRYDPAHLRAADGAAKATAIETARSEVRALATKAHERYAALVALRRAKLGSAPDERFYGEVAKAVNDAIAQLAAMETELLGRSEEIGVSPPAGEAGSKEYGDEGPLAGRLNELLKSTEKFVNPDELEAYLTAQAARADEAQVLRDKQKQADQLARDSQKRLTERANAKQALEHEQSQLQTELPGRLGTLRALAGQARNRVERLLTYAQELERFDPPAAQAIYADLESALHAPIPIGEGRLVQDVVADQALLIQLATDLDQGVIPAHQLDVTVSQLEVVLGDAGRLTEVVDRLEAEKADRPLASYQSQLRRETERLREELGDLEHELQTKQAELKKLRRRLRHATLDEVAAVDHRLARITDRKPQLPEPNLVDQSELDKQRQYLQSLFTQRARSTETAPVASSVNQQSAISDLQSSVSVPLHANQATASIPIRRR